MEPINITMRYCRRCGTRLTQQAAAHVFVCEQQHVLFNNASPAVGLVLFNGRHEVLLLERAIDPGKGRLDIPGGFCDGAEPLEQAIARELQEEVGITADQYSRPEFVLSAIDAYNYGGEVLPVLSVIFQARLLHDVQAVPADDAATAQFMPLQDVDLETVYFPSVRAALAQARDQKA